MSQAIYKSLSHCLAYISVIDIYDNTENTVLSQIFGLKVTTLQVARRLSPLREKHV